MKKHLVIQFVVQAVNHKINGSTLSFDRLLCTSIVLPSDEVISTESEISMSVKAERAFESFIFRPKDVGQSIYFSGTYKNKNGVDVIYLSKVLKCQVPPCGQDFVKCNGVGDDWFYEFGEFSVRDK